MNEQPLPLLVVIAGATAIGKTSLSIALAKHFQSVILSADSRQCYQEMHIGTAKPDLEEQEGVPHYFIDSHSISETLTAVDYEEYALQHLTEIFKKHSIAIVVGGTGLYIQALLQGFDDMPVIDKKIEEEIFNLYDEKGMVWLQETLRTTDPEYEQAGLKMDNPHRMLRALVFKKSTGQSITHFRKGKNKERPFRSLLIALDMPREKLYDRINQRVGIMVENGLLEEAKSLFPLRGNKNLDTVGYREIFDYFDEKISLEEAIELIKRNTRRYAKRQITWFKKMDGVEWFDAKDVEGIIQRIDKAIKNEN